jgi:hypothetical protein
MRFFALTMAMCLLAANLCAQTQPPIEQLAESEEVKAVVEQFSDLDAAGTWLAPEQWDERQAFFNHDWPWSRPESISVIKSYQVGEMKRNVGFDGQAFYIVHLDYVVWGQIDSFLHFTGARGQEGESPTVGQPVQRERITELFFSDTFEQMGEPENKKVVEGPPRWRMNSPGETENVGVDAAIRWVTEMRDNSSDPAIRYNAERTLAILKSLSAGAPLPAPYAGAPRVSASRVANQFVKLESSSTPDRAHGLAQFFVETPKPDWDKLQVVDVVGTNVDTNRDSTRVVIYTNALGDLDSSLRLTNYPSVRMGPVNNSACNGQDIFGFMLVLSDKHWEIAADGSAKVHEGPLAWRVENISYDPFISLDVAIRYVMQRRDKTTDPLLKENAEATLAVLTFFKRHLGEELPPVLMAKAGDSCMGGAQQPSV